jgi:hypothetical protein
MSAFLDRMIAETNAKREASTTKKSSTSVAKPAIDSSIDWDKTLSYGLSYIIPIVILLAGIVGFVLLAKRANKPAISKKILIILIIALFVGGLAYREYVTQRKIDSLNKKLESTQSDIESTANDYSSQLDDLEQDNSDLKQQNDDLEQEVSDLQDQQETKTKYFPAPILTPQENSGNSIDNFLEEQKQERQQKYQDDMNKYLDSQTDNDPTNDWMPKPMKPLDY